MVNRSHKKYSSKLDILRTECKYFAKYIFSMGTPGTNDPNALIHRKAPCRIEGGF
jgi:hypothetical protein